jgi:hypothetical protein
MHRTPIIAALISILFATLFVLMLAIGFGANPTQALSQALPILLATGLAIGLGGEVLRRELA